MFSLSAGTADLLRLTPRQRSNGQDQKKDVPLACVSRRGKFAFLPLDATPQTEDLFLRYL